MPRGQSSQTWFPELVALLRRSWRHDMDWLGVIALRDELEAQLKAVINSRGIVPAIVRCSDCGHVGPGRAPSLTVRAVLFAANRFGLEPEESFRAMDKAWAKHRKTYQLDPQGRPPGATPAV